ncbi:MFS general substrate transporter [Hymenopellis radicata]|nr:MFS general substrate transporter [Hymenopellis radicata]
MSLKEPSSPIDEKQSVDDVKLSVLEVDHDAEVGYDIYASTKDNLVFTPAEERVIIRKIDLWILPCFCLTQGLAFLDKTALNYGNLFGMKADLRVTSAQYSWFAGAFLLRIRFELSPAGYLVSVEPSTWLLQRLVHAYHTGKIMGCVCTIWGVVVIPGLGLMTPFWWRIREQPYCFNGVAGIVGGFLAYGLGHVTNAAVPSWALIFLTLGAITTAWGVYILLMLPDSPVTAPFLDDRQKAIAIKRVAENKTGIKNKTFKLYQAVQAFQDPKTWLLILAAAAAQIPNGVVTNFSSIIISNMGFTQFQTTLLDIPGSIIQILSLVGSGYLAGKFKNSRAILMFIGNAACIIAAACLTYAPQDQKWGRLAAFWFTSFSSVGFAMDSSWSLPCVSAIFSSVLVLTGSQNVGGFTKRQVTSAATFIAYCVIQNIAGPHTLIDSEEDIGYPTATKAMLAGYTVKTGCHILLGLYMWYENRRRDALAEASGDDISEEERARLAEEAGMNDVTEFDNKYFRYVL